MTGALTNDEITDLNNRLRERDAKVRAKAIKECVALVKALIDDRINLYQKDQSTFFRGQALILELLESQIAELMKRK